MIALPSDSRTPFSIGRARGIQDAISVLDLEHYSESKRSSFAELPEASDAPMTYEDRVRLLHGYSSGMRDVIRAAISGDPIDQLRSMT